MADITEAFAVLLAIKAEREEIHALKVAEQVELPQRVHFRDGGARFDLILTVVKKAEAPKG